MSGPEHPEDVRLEWSVSLRLEAWSLERTAAAMRGLESRHLALAKDCRMRLDAVGDGSLAAVEHAAELAVHAQAAAMCRAEADALEKTAASLR